LDEEMARRAVGRFRFRVAVSIPAASFVDVVVVGVASWCIRAAAPSSTSTAPCIENRYVANFVVGPL
jgi:hypothetical protein